MYVLWGKSRLQIRTQYGSTHTGDLCNAEVGFNTIMYYVLWMSKPSEKTNALSLRDRRAPGLYQQYWAIGRYVRFYYVYVKSANERVQG
jgi:hypothetical protein